MKDKDFLEKDLQDELQALTLYKNVLEDNVSSLNRDIKNISRLIGILSKSIDKTANR